jgi:high affinity sulfate transporter 1
VRGNLETWVPGLRTVRTYQRAWFRSDLLAGISVAAVAMPIGIAYARLAGFPPVVGLYASILPPVAYALFGSSRQLIVNPDAATCAIVAATLAPLAANNPTRYGDLAVALTLLTGLFCIVGGIARLGVIANFLSRPILTGYLNGIALSIISGQLGGLLGFKVETHGFLRTITEVVSRLQETHLPTLLLGLTLFAVQQVLRRVAPKMPAALVTAILGIGAVYLLRLDRQGVAVVGAVPAGFPALRIPAVSLNDLWSLALDACAIVFVSFCSMMTTARGFAAKNNYAIDANQDMIALGASDIASGLIRGFTVSGADSRTAVADSAGGKTQVTSLVAAAVMAGVLLFLTAPLAYLPTAALAAILISSAFSLFDIPSLRRYYRLNRSEFLQSVVATLGVMSVGVLPGVLVAVGLALLRLLSLASRPHDAVLGVIAGREGNFNLAEEADARPIPGLLIYRFDSAIVFFNADYFLDRVRALIAGADRKPEWLLFDAEAINLLDVTGADALETLRAELAGQGIVLAIARAKGLFRATLERTGIAERIGAARLFPSVRDGTRAFLERGEAVAGKD